MLRGTWGCVWRRGALALVGALGLIAGCLEGPPPARGTTRVCPDQADGDPLCFQQCADTENVDCKVLDPEASELEECQKDDATGDYLMTMEGELVPPAGEDLCFALMVDAGGCDDLDADLEVSIFGAGEDLCYDVNCAVLAPENCE